MRIPELDLLRFLAAASVVAYHLLTPWPTLRSITRFGWLGVPAFFMISGFVILWTAQGRTLYGFATARIARLYPSFWVAVLLTAAIVGTTWPVLLANLTMVPKPLGFPRLDGVYWTLEVEIVFYVFVAALVVTRQLKHMEWWLPAWLALYLIDITTPLSLELITLKGFAPFFASGCYFYLLQSHGLNAWRIVGILASMVLCIVAAVLNQGNFMAGEAALIIAAIVLLIHGIFALRLIRPWLRVTHGMFVVGSLTYPLYLTHNEIGKHLIERLPLPLWLATACAIVIVLMISAIMAAAIERRACPRFQRVLAHATKPVT